MSTAVASAAPPQVPLAPPPSEPEASPQSSFPSRPSPNQTERNMTSNIQRTGSPNTPVILSEGAAKQKLTPDGKRSPISSRHGPPKIIVKKEPTSSPPEAATTSRHRPRKLDLVSSNTQNQGANSAKPSAPLTSRESASIAMHDVGLACLSPGFQTQDPTMQQQLQRSISVRDQQRHIIESRLQKTAKPTDSEGRNTTDNPFGASGMKTPSTSKKRPPNGLSIVPPSHEQFANERVIQSAPLNQTFTGRHQPHPMTRHIANQPSNLANTSHIHHVPANQTSNKLPPISDVFAGEGLGMPRKEGGPYHSNSNSSHSNHRPTFPSPGQPPPSSHPPPTSRDREYRSAEDAVADMTQGREELLPKMVHYRSNHPPTPPSPPTQGGAASSRQAYSHLNGESLRSGRRRPRSEYERDIGTPPLGSGPETRERRGPYMPSIDSPESQRRKREEFMGLCARAWDLFHS